MRLFAKYKTRQFWEYIDTANEDSPKEMMLAEYQMAYGPGWVFEWRA